MDRRIRAITADAAIQITAVETTGMVERARNIHKTLPLATAALGKEIIFTTYTFLYTTFFRLLE